MTLFFGAPGGYVAPLEVPEVPPPPPERDGTPCVFVWTGWDGSTWELSQARSGVRLKRGLRGLHFPPEQLFTDASPALAGSAFRGTRTLDREVVLRVAVYSGGSSAEWYAYDRAFMRTLDPRRLGTLTCTAPDGSSRRLPLRYVPDDDGFAVDPGQIGWAPYDLTFVAHQPFWRGETVTRRFEADPPSNFRSGRQRYVSSSNTLDGAALDNPGDVEAHPRYRVDGPVDSVTIGLGRRFIDVLAVPAGESLLIDTSPAEQVALDSSGADRTPDLLGARVEFAAVPPGESVPLSLQMVGTGRVTVDLEPLHYRAW